MPTHATQWLDNVVVSTPTVGTGTLTLGATPGTVAGQTEVAAGATNGSTLSYRIDDNGQWEVGYGTYTSSGRTLTRTVLYSSNSNAAINLDGAGLVRLTLIAEDIGAMALASVVPRTFFTPTVSFTTPGDSTFVYNTQTGAYAKVGPLVTFWINLRFTPTYTTASGSIQISTPGLPVPSDAAWAWPIRRLTPAVWPPGPPDTYIVAVNSGGTIFLQTQSSGTTAPNNLGTAQILSGTNYFCLLSGFFF